MTHRKCWCIYTWEMLMYLSIHGRCYTIVPSETPCWHLIWLSHPIEAPRVPAVMAPGPCLMGPIPPHPIPASCPNRSHHCHTAMYHSCFRYIGVTEADYEWLTVQLMEIANRCRFVNVCRGCLVVHPLHSLHANVICGPTLMPIWPQVL
jgi:hypothetical protein